MDSSRNLVGQRRISTDGGGRTVAVIGGRWRLLTNGCGWHFGGQQRLASWRPTAVSADIGSSWKTMANDHLADSGGRATAAPSGRRRLLTNGCGWNFGGQQRLVSWRMTVVSADIDSSWKTTANGHLADSDGRTAAAPSRRRRLASLFADGGEQTAIGLEKVSTNK